MANGVSFLLMRSQLCIINRGLRFYAAKDTPMREIIKQERNFVADEMAASMLITESLSRAESKPSNESIIQGMVSRKEISSFTLDTEFIPQKQPPHLCSNFLGSLIKGGVSQHAIVARVNARLKLDYQIDNPIQLAIDSVKPLLEYKSMMGRRQTLPRILSPHRQNGIAIRWLIEAATERKYNTVRSLEKGLYDEIAEIFAGTSSLYAKRFNMHKSA